MTGGFPYATPFSATEDPPGEDASTTEMDEANYKLPQWLTICFFPLTAMANYSRPANLKAARTKGFTLIETIVACAVITIFTVGAILAMTQLNSLASVSRLRTLSLGLAQQRIDEVLTIPWLAGAARPTLLANGTQTEASLTLNSDAFNSQTALKSAYTTLSSPVVARRTTTITDLSARRIRATVTVDYTYRGRNYQVVLSTIRVTDTI